MITVIAAILTSAPIPALILIAYRGLSLWHHMLTNVPANADILSGHLYTILFVGNLGAVLYALGSALHLVASRESSKARPWVWKQVWLCGLALVPQFQSILPVGAIAILIGLRSKELKKLNMTKRSEAKKKEKAPDKAVERKEEKPDKLDDKDIENGKDTADKTDQQ